MCQMNEWFDGGKEYWRDLVEKQIKIEEDMTSNSIERFHKFANRAKETGTESNALHGIMLMKYSIENLSKFIENFLEESKTGKASRLAKSSFVISMLDSDVSAFIALKTVMNRISTSQPLTALSNQIGQEICDEIRFNIWKETDNKTFTRLLKRCERRTASKHYKRFGLIKNCKRFIEAETIEVVPRQERIHVGIKLIELLIQSTGLVEMYLADKRKSAYMVQPTESTLRWIEKVNLQGQDLYPSYSPMVVVPERWSNPENGGYLNKRIPFVKTWKKDGLEIFKNRDLSFEYDVINALQGTSWKVNKKVLDVMERAWDMNRNWEGIPNRHPIEIPVCPFPKTVKFSEMTNAQKNEYMDWKNLAISTHRMNTSRTSKAIAFTRTLSMAKDYSQYDQFYFPYQNDYRSRKYVVSSFLSPQGTEYSKALLLFSKGQPIENKSHADWLAIHGANCFGVDKYCFQRRIDFIERESDEIVKIAEDPFQCLSWQEASDPWLFLAFCFEWSEFLRVGYGFKSYIPVCVDGSNNGLQHFAAMLRDPSSAKATNLTDEPYPQDIYQDVADRCIEELKKRSSRELLARQWLEIGAVDRKLCKGPVMVVPYGGTRHTCREKIEDTIHDRVGSGQLKTPWMHDVFKETSYLANIMWVIIEDTVSSARVAMDYIRDVADLASKHKKMLSWETQTGFPVLQDYPSQKMKRVRTHINGVLIKPAVLEPDKTSIDSKRQRNGSSPNFIHSLDATNLSKTIHSCIKSEIKDFMVIHDQVGTHACNMEYLNKMLRETFVEMYSSRDVLEVLWDFAKTFDKDFPKPPTKGNLDLSEVLRSKYFFA